MTNSKSTKRALFTSALAMLMCVAMLIGTTFAWFTDTASTAVNKIQSGTLKVGLQMLSSDGTAWSDAEGQTLSFKKASDASGTEVLWEPGCTYELPALRVVNNGNLAFKYKVVVSGIDGDAKLLEAIDFTVKFNNEEVDLDNWEGILLPKGKIATEGTAEEVETSSALVISGHMKEEAGNEYQGLSVDGIGITVYATQYTYEYDSYDKMYDLNSMYVFDDYVNVTKTVSADGDTVIKDKEENATITATIPKDSLHSDITELALIKKPTENPSSVEVKIGESALTTDVKIINTATKEVISATEGKYFTIDIQLGQVDLQKFYHKGVQLAAVENKADLTSTGLYYYDFESGIVTFTTDSFSTFTAVFKFSGGNGTEEYPYLIGNTNDWKGINKEEQSENKYYKQIADITAPTYVAKFAGTYDGGGYKLTARYKFTTMGYAALFYEACGHVSFKNINVVMTDYPVNLLFSADLNGTGYGADFDTITFNGTAGSVNVGNFGLVVINPLWTGGDKEVVYNFTNITNNISIKNNGNCTGVFIGSGPCFNVKTILNFADCVNNGNITGTSYVGYLYGNPSYVGSISATDSVININNCSNTGTMHAVNTDGLAAFALKMDELNTIYQESVGGTYISGPGVLAEANLAVNQSGTSFSVSGAPTEYSYKLVLSVGSTYHTADGHAWKNDEVTKELLGNHDGNPWYVSNGKKYFCELNADESATGGHNTIKALDKRTAKTKGFDVDNLTFTNSYALVVKDNTTYLILDIGDHQYVDSNVSLFVYAYDSSNKLAGVKGVS